MSGHGSFARNRCNAGASGQFGAPVRCPKGGVFCKAPKPEQDCRIDLPALGVATVEGAHRAGLRGIAVKSGGVLMIDAPCNDRPCG